MAYITLQEKIEALADNGEEPVELPLDMLAAVAGGTPLAYIVDTAPLSARDVLDDYTLESATGFFVEFRRERKGIRKFCYVRFQGVKKKVYVSIDDSDFFNLGALDRQWTGEYFHKLKSSDLVIAAYPKIYLLENLSELMEGGFERAKWDQVVEEGTLLTIVDTMMIDKYPFVRVIYKGKIFWSFGALVREEDFNSQDHSHNHHFI